MLSDAGWQLTGRAEELDLLEDTVVKGRDSVVVAGGAGVGKSRLVGDFLERLNRRGRRTVLVRTTRSAASVPFGPFARWAPQPARPQDRPLATERLHVLQAIARALAPDDDPVVVAVDDAHLLDDGSAALVFHLAVETSATVVTTVRSGERCPDAVMALWKEGVARRVELQPLSEPELIELSERRLGGVVGPKARQRLWALTGGVPLFLREVLHAAIAGGALIRSEDAWGWRGNLNACERLRELMGDRLSCSDTDEQRLLELVAIGEPLPLDMIAEVGDGALARVERRGLVAADDVAGHPTIRLAHPLYGELIRADVPALVEREHRRALAAGARRIGLHEREPLRVASWCLGSGTEAPSVDVLVAGANQAVALTEWELAVQLAEGAEIAGAGPQATLVRAAALVQLGRWPEADALLTDLVREALASDDHDLAVKAIRFHAGFLYWDQGDLAAGREVLSRAAKQLATPARARALCEAAYLAVFALDLTEAVDLAAEAMDDAGHVVDVRVQSTAAAALARLCQGRLTEAQDAADEALPLVADVVAADPYVSNPAVAALPAQCLALALNGRLDEAATRAQAALDVLRRDDAWMVICVSTACLVGRIAVMQGRLVLAQRTVREATTMLVGVPAQRHWMAAILATAAAQLGDAATADQALTSVDTTKDPNLPLFMHEVSLARSWATAARGELAAAQAHAQSTAASAAHHGARALEMLALLDLARLGAPEAAMARLTELSHTIDGPFAVTAAAYAGASAAADGDALDHISAKFEAMGATLLAAEAAAAAATAHRIAGRRTKHRASLSRARALAVRCDSARTPALLQIDTDLDLHTLTQREHEVIRLAAQGLTNREIAARLFVSIRTVNAHLTHAYTKLGTSDRSNLASLIATAPKKTHAPQPEGP